MKEIVFATNNEHKLREAREILSGYVRVHSLREIGCFDDILETGSTLEENALIKARWVKERYGYDCFADDTGLIVDALNGAPGVMTARYAGPECDPDANIDKLLTDLEGKGSRKAHFTTIVAWVTSSGEHLFEGRVDGIIAGRRQGEYGFGYDPIFIAEESGLTFAEMTAEAKNDISHRGRAMRKFMAALTSDDE